MQPEISIVIPAWKESERLPGNLRKISKYLMEEHLEGKKSEVIIVLEACEDRELTKVGIEQCRKNFPSINIIMLDNEERYGKGYTVKRGVMIASGKYILMTDADLSTPIDELTQMWNFLKEQKLDCVIGKRVQIVKQPPHRKLMGWGFRTLTKIILGLPFYDTQCGFKLFSNEFGKNVFDLVEIPGFGFDTEMLALGLKKGYAIGEREVSWYDDVRTTVDPIADSIKMFKNLLEIRARIKNNPNMN